MLRIHNNNNDGNGNFSHSKLEEAQLRKSGERKTGKKLSCYSESEKEKLIAHVIHLIWGIRLRERCHF
jgi:hypothetical protein